MTKQPGACEQCGKLNSVRAGRKFCSRECGGLARRSASMTCQNCGEGFRPTRADRKFCSRECGAASQQRRVERTCQACGTTFRVTVSVRARGARFCSRTCKDEGLRIDGPARYCAICGSRMERRRGPSMGLESNKNFMERQTCSVECGADLASQGRARPWQVGPRKLLARSCCECGRLLPGNQFTTDGNGVHVHSCHSCLWVSLSPEQRARHVERSRRWLESSQMKTLSRATRHGYQWTGPELETVLREDLSREALALLLGRTTAAVATARAKARHDPKWSKVAGV